MMSGYRIRDPQKGTKTHICEKCTKSLPVSAKIEASAEEVSSSQFADVFCLICQNSLTSASASKDPISTNYPEEIATFLDKVVLSDISFVYPMIESEYEEEDLAEGVTRNKAVKTKYDPVIFSLPENKLENSTSIERVLDAMMGKDGSRIQYTTEKITDEENSLVAKEYTVFTSYA